MRSPQALLTCAVAIACQTVAGACWQTRNVDLARTTTLLPRRPLIIRAPEPLLKAGLYNQLWLQVLPPDSLNWRPGNWGWGVRRSDGVLVTVGAAMLHADNSSDTISSVGYSQGTNDYLTIGPSIHDSLRPPFVAVRISVTDSITVSRIIWTSWTGS